MKRYALLLLIGMLLWPLTLVTAQGGGSSADPTTYFAYQNHQFLAIDNTGAVTTLGTLGEWGLNDFTIFRLDADHALVYGYLTATHHLLTPSEIIPINTGALTVSLTPLAYEWPLLVARETDERTAIYLLNVETGAVETLAANDDRRAAYATFLPEAVIYTTGVRGVYQLHRYDRAMGVDSVLWEMEGLDLKVATNGVYWQVAASQGGGVWIEAVLDSQGAPFSHPDLLPDDQLMVLPDGVLAYHEGASAVMRFGLAGEAATVYPIPGVIGGMPVATPTITDDLLLQLDGQWLLLDSDGFEALGGVIPNVLPDLTGRWLTTKGAEGFQTWDLTTRAVVQTGTAFGNPTVYHANGASLVLSSTEGPGAVVTAAGVQSLEYRGGVFPWLPLADGRVLVWSDGATLAAGIYMQTGAEMTLLAADAYWVLTTGR